MEPETLGDFIAHRRTVLRGMRESALQRLGEIDRELAQLDAAESAIASPVSRARALIERLEGIRAPRGAIKKAIVRTLQEHPDGLDAISILREMNTRDGTSYERTSLSPQLSRLKADSFVRLEGNIWRLVPQSALFNQPEIGDDESADDNPPEDREPDTGGTADCG